MLRIEFVTADLIPGPWDGVVLTSANAARALIAHPRLAEVVALPALVVGRRTAAAAADAGFNDITSAGGDADDLARLLAAKSRGSRMLYLAGEDQATDLGAALQRSGVKLDTVVVYRAAPVTRLPAAVRNAIAGGGCDGVLHYSTRTAAAFIAVLEAAGLRDALALPQFCLSAQVAKPLAAAGATDLRIATRPEEVALLDLVGRGAMN
jgi:uroporphyrinogen-III synthase